MSELAFKIVGVGGMGIRVAQMLSGTCDCETMGVHTDASYLLRSSVPVKILIGKELTKGRSTGNNIELGNMAALADMEKITSVIEGLDVLFLIAGLGGGTGAGVSPVIAEAAKYRGSLNIAFVNLPFNSEGKICRKNAQESLQNLRPYCDLIIVIENDLFLKSIGEASIRQSFEEINMLLMTCISIMFQRVKESGREFISEYIKGYGTLCHGKGISLDSAIAKSYSNHLLSSEIYNAGSVLIRFICQDKSKVDFNNALGNISTVFNEEAQILWDVKEVEEMTGYEVIMVVSGLDKPRYLP